MESNPIYILRNPFKGVLTSNKGICDIPFVTRTGDVHNQATHAAVHVLTEQEKREDLQNAIEVMHCEL